MKSLTKKERIAIYVGICIITLIVLIMPIVAYNHGLDEGREETIQILNNIADDYEFSIRDKEGWVLGAGTNGNFYKDSNDSLKVDYSWDDCKIKLQYIPR